MLRYDNKKNWGKNIIDMLMKDEMPTTFSREKKHLYIVAL